MYHKPLAYGIRAHDIRKIAERNEFLTIYEIQDILQKVLEETTKRVVKDLRKWINSKVPKMTGRLRRDLLSHLRTSYVRSSVLRIFIQTSIDYAERVNEFETKNVRHKGKRVKYRGKTYILHDFRAIGHFFDKMVIIAINLINYHLAKVKSKYSSSKLKFHEMKIIKLW